MLYNIIVMEKLNAMLTTTQELEHKTKLYWRLSSIRRGQIQEPLTVKQGLTLVANTLKHMSDTRPLYWKFLQLQEDIIHEPTIAKRQLS